MITAPNKKDPANPEQNPESISAVGGFVKVLNSIQGLQQRLGDFSIEAIASAEANINILIRRLAMLQNKLETLTVLKRSMADAEAMLKQMPETDYDLVDPASLETHPQLHAIANAGKIIRLHKFLKLAQAGAASVSIDTEVDRPGIAAPLAQTMAGATEEKIPDQRVQTLSEAEREQEAKVWPAPKATAPTTAAIELPPPQISSEIEHNFHARADCDNQPHALPLTHSDAIAVGELEPPQSPHSEGLRPTVTAGVPEESAGVFFPPGSFAVAQTAVVVTQSEFHAIKTEERWQIITPPERGQEPPTSAVPQVRPPHIAATAEAGTDFDDERVSAAVDSAFDRRLLDDLIQTYGELIPDSDTSGPRPTTPIALVQPTPSPLAASEPSMEGPTDRLKRLLPPEPRFLSPERATIIESVTVETVQARVPSVRSTDDLDRQLKKIIKDYGEYDLYSQPSSSAAFKRGGIIAFIVLALVLTGVYFFRSPVQISPAPISSVLPSGAQEPSPAAPPPGRRNSGAVDAKGVSRGDLKAKTTTDTAVIEAKP